MNEYDISEAFRRIENDLIDSLIRNLDRHRAQEEKEGIDWDAWQTVQLRELEKYRFQNRHRFDDDFKEINQAIHDLCVDSFNKGDTAEWINLGEIVNQDYARKGTVLLGVNSKRLDALLEATQNDFEKAEHAVLRKANDEYRKIIFDAQVYANQGGTYEQAVDMATKDFLKNGIKSIVYSNGARHQISDYAKMALRTGAKRAYLMGLGQQMARLGIHTVRVNRRDGACPYCTPWLGRVLIDDVYNEGTKEEARQKGYPLLSEAIEQGFLHPNCKDIYSMYIEGVSKPEEPYTDKEKDDLQKIYDLEQEINKARGIRDSYSRLYSNSIDKSDIENYRILRDKWNDKVRDLENQLEELKKKVGMETAPDEVPETVHGKMRELIDVETEAYLKGIVEIPDGSITVGEPQRMDDTDWRGNPIWWINRPVTIDKRVAIDFGDLTQRTRNKFRWASNDNEAKAFYLQKTNGKKYFATLQSQQIEDPESIANKFFNEGYEYLGEFSITKYNRYWTVHLGQKNGKYAVAVDRIAEEQAVTKATIDKVLAKEKIVSKYLWDNKVPFKDIRSRGDRYDKDIEDKFNHAMEVFHTGIEADLPVSLVSRDAYENVKGEEIYRGIARDSSLRLGLAPPPKDCARQLMEGGVGDCFPSRGIYGDGVGYWSNSTDIGNNYSSHSEGVIVRAKIKDDARTIMYDDAVRLFEEVYNRHPNDDSVYFSKSQRGSSSNLEVGKAMQILGYDVIIKPNGDWSGATFYIILNRSALVGIAGDYIWKMIG